jgi:DNA polymerase III delta subunit
MATPRSDKSKSTAKTKELVVPEGPPRVILLTGSDSEKKKTQAQRLLTEAADQDFADFDTEILDGSHATASGALSSVSTIPLGSGKKVILIRDVNQMDTEEQKRLAAEIDRVPAGGLLILHTGSPIFEEGKAKRGSVVATELANAVKKVGQMLDFALPKADDSRDYLLQAAREAGKKLSSEAISLLSQLPADDVIRLTTEVAKAAAHAGENPVISAADVEAVVSRSPDDVIFKLCDAVGMRRTGEALGHVSTLFRGGGRADGIAARALVMLARQIRLLAQFRYLGEKRMAGRNASPPSPEVLALLPADGAGGMVANPRLSWMADKYVNQARNFSGAELAVRLERLLMADLALKGVEPGGDSPQIVLERLVVELC